MAVTVTKETDGTFTVQFPTSEEDFVVLPAGSSRTEVGDAIRYGTNDTYLEVKGTGNARTFTVHNGLGSGNLVMHYSSAKQRTTLGPERDAAFNELEAAWVEAAEAPGDPEHLKEGGRRSRLKKKTRRAKRNTRNHKGKKLRKLTTRRR